MKRVKVALTCPACAGPLQVREGDTHTVCPNCSSSLMLSGAVRKYVLPSVVSPVEVLRSVRRELQKVNPSGVDSANVRKPVLYYVPFWHCSAQVNGYVLGVEPVYEEKEIPVTDVEGQAPSGYAVAVTRKVRIRKGAAAVEREIQLSGSVNVSAANLEPLGIPTLSAQSQLAISGMEIQKNNLPEGLEVLEDESGREGVFVDPVVTLPEAREQTVQYLGRLGSGRGYGLEERWEFSVVSGHRDALVYYPLWVTGYMFGGRFYQVVADGCSGNVLRGRFPTSGRDRRILTVAAGLLWAGITPYTFDLLFSGKLSSGTHSGGDASGCLGAILLVLVSLGVGTYHLLKVLSDMEQKGSDRVIC